MKGGSLTPLADEDPAAALQLKGSVFMTNNFRLIADAGSTTEGDVTPGSTTDIIGAWSMTTLGDKDAILVQLADTDATPGYVNQTQWTDPSAFYLIQDAEKLRISPLYETATSLKKGNWLIGEQGLDKILSSVDSGGSGT